MISIQTADLQPLKGANKQVLESDVSVHIIYMYYRKISN